MKMQVPAWKFMIQFQIVFFEGERYLVERYNTEWPDNPALPPKYCEKLP